MIDRVWSLKRRSAKNSADTRAPQLALVPPVCWRLLLGVGTVWAIAALAVRPAFAEGGDAPSPAASAPREEKSGAEPSAAATQPGGAPEDVQLHIVTAGDNLHRLARDYGTTVEAIQQSNGLDSSTIVIGHVLKIPSPLASNLTAFPIGLFPAVVEAMGAADQAYHVARNEQAYALVNSAQQLAAAFSAEGARIHPVQPGLGSDRGAVNLAFDGYFYAHSGSLKRTAEFTTPTLSALSASDNRIE